MPKYGIFLTGLLKDIPSSEAERLLSDAPILDADLHLVSFVFIYHFSKVDRN